MPEKLLDLGKRARWADVVLTVGKVVVVLVGLACLAEAVLGPAGPGARLVAGGFAAFLLLLGVALWRTRNGRPRRLGIDHEGIRLVNRLGHDIVRVPWGDIAGVGVMTNEAARRRHRSAARSDAVPSLSRRMASVPVWLEIYPSGPDAVARHPELRGAWRLGSGARLAHGPRWLLMLCDDLGQEPLPVGEHVRRWRPELWRGHQEGSAVFGRRS